MRNWSRWWIAETMREWQIKRKSNSTKSTQQQFCLLSRPNWHSLPRSRDMKRIFQVMNKQIKVERALKYWFKEVRQMPANAVKGAYPSKKMRVCRNSHKLKWTTSERTPQNFGGETLEWFCSCSEVISIKEFWHIYIPFYHSFFIGRTKQALIGKATVFLEQANCSTNDWHK